MTSHTGKWLRVSRSSPCPICAYPDWCGVSEDGNYVTCMRIADGAIKDTRNGGFLHRLNPYADCHLPSRSLQLPLGRGPDLRELAKKFSAAVNPNRIEQLAEALGVSTRALVQLGTGWADADAIRETGTRWRGDHGCWTFPMTNPGTGIVTGIRLRTTSGNKCSIRGGKEGLFIPSGLPNKIDRLGICEGPTDTAALIDLGVDTVIGRPSCAGAINQTIDAVKLWRPREVIVFPDSDLAGQHGAMTLVPFLAARVPVIKMVSPPGCHKDIRAWKQAGATIEQVVQLYEGATAISLSVETSTNEVSHG